MTKVLLNGYLGRMGRFISDLASQREDVEIAAGADVNESSENFGFNTYTSFADVKEDVDVIIDFSNPSALASLLEYATTNKVPAVICTTGLSEEQKASLNEASKVVPVFFSANMSIGINLVIELARKAAAILYPDFNIEVVEAHHNQKLDAPSGTALMIADGMKEVLDSDVYYEYNRAAKREKRPENEIGIHAIRAGTIVGEHEVIFGGEDEIITISHSARSRKIFANGSLNAAVFLADKEPGMYSMKEMID